MTRYTATNDDFNEVQKRSTTILAILAAIAFAFAASTAYSQAIITAGFDNQPDLADGGDVTPVTLPAGKTAENLVGLGVEITDTGYFWWTDGTVTQGTGRSAADIIGAQRFKVPFGKQVSDIVGMAIDLAGNVYTYYRDFTVSIGDPIDLSSVDRPRPFILPIGYAATDIIDAGMLHDDVVLFFRDGTHHYTDVDDYRNFTITAPDYERGRYTIPRGFGTNNVAGMDFADSDGRLYTMFATDHPVISTVKPTGFTNMRTRRTVTTNTFASTTDGITISNGGWSVTLPSDR